MMNEDRQKILTIGTGYVGLVTSVGLAKLGHNVSCFDIDPSKIAKLKRGEPPFYEPGLSDLLSEAISSGLISFYTDIKQAYNGQRFVMIAVPTPMDVDGSSDLSALFDAINGIIAVIEADTILIIKSTVPVGIFNDLSNMKSVLESKYRVDFVSCPEFLAEGSAINDFFNPKRTVVGSDDNDINHNVAALFSGVSGPFISTDAKTAQMIKYSANSFLATRVAFINEIAQLCEALHIDASAVSSALLMDPRLGTGYLTQGIGFAGPCLPKDISALVVTGRRVGVEPRLLESVSAQNNSHLDYITNEIIKLIGNGTDIVTVFGLSFKPKTDDVRNSFALKIINSLINRTNVQIRATDPVSIGACRDLICSNRVSYHLDPFEAAEGSGLQIFLTPWDGYKSLNIRKLAECVSQRRIFDATGMFDPAEIASNNFIYRGVGRFFENSGPPPVTIFEKIPKS